MYWTWRMTLIGLGIAALLGALALIIDWHTRAEREEIIASGQHAAGRTQGGIVEYVANGRTHRVRVYNVGGAQVRNGSWITVYFLPSEPERIASPDGYSSVQGSPAPYMLGLFAAVAAIVSVAGRAESAYRGRTRARRIRRPRVWGRRGVVRRNDWGSRVILGIVLIGLALMPFAGTPIVPAFLATAPAIVGFYLLGVSRGVVVTPVELVVYTAFTVTWIPRSLVTGFEAEADGRVGIEFARRKPVTVGVGISKLYEGPGFSFNRFPGQERTIEQLKMLVAAIAEEPNAGEPSVKRRWAAITVLAASLAGFCYLIFALSTGRIS